MYIENLILDLLPPILQNKTWVTGWESEVSRGVAKETKKLAFSLVK